MGASESSRLRAYSPWEPAAMRDQGSATEYHLVACPVIVTPQAQSECSGCSCTDRVDHVMDGDELYELLSQQYSKGYRLLYLTCLPGDLQVMRSGGALRANFQGFFCINPNNLGPSLDQSVTCQLRMERAFVRAVTRDTGSPVTSLQSRQTDFSAVVECIVRNTQRGERLISATVTGHSGGKNLGQDVGVDLYFEVPSPGPCEVQVYNIVRTPVHVEFCLSGFLFFPGIPHNWNLTFNDHLKEGWRLVDVFVDIPMIEQMHIPILTRRNYCRPMDTGVYWFFEKPASQAQENVARYEGTIVEHPAVLKDTKRSNRCYGLTSEPNWLPIIQDMGSRGWELSCAVECHAVESRGLGHREIKSLLFFQRPLT